LTPIRRQAGNIRQVSTASGRGFRKKALMFDNEIDWVMRIRHESLVPAAARQLAGFSCMDDAIQGRAQYAPQKDRGECKCSMQEECL